MREAIEVSRLPQWVRDSKEQFDGEPWSTSEFFAHQKSVSVGFGGTLWDDLVLTHRYRGGGLRLLQKLIRQSMDTFFVPIP